MGASEREAFRKVRLPAALPAFFTGLRISITYAVVGAVFAEYVGAYEGLGIWMQLAKNAYRTDLVFGAVTITAALSIGLFAGVGAVERLVVPDAKSFRSSSSVRLPAAAHSRAMAIAMGVASGPETPNPDC